METCKIKSGNRTTAVMHAFLSGYGFAEKGAIAKILNEMPYFPDIGYGGFRTRQGLKRYLRWTIGSPRKFKFKKDPEKKIAQIAGKAIIECRKTAKNGSIIKIFVFPTFDNFVKRKMYGISGFCAWKNSMLLFIHPDAKNVEEHLMNTICHEYAHAVQNNYSRRRTLLDGMVFEGLAEHFREAVAGGSRSPWASSLKEKKARKLFGRLKNKLNSASWKFYAEVFYEGKKYPLWAGYAIGYYIAKEFLQTSRLSWLGVFKTPPKEILEKSGFA